MEECYEYMRQILDAAKGDRDIAVKAIDAALEEHSGNEFSLDCALEYAEHFSNKMQN